MASVASQLIEEVTAQAQRDSLEEALEICPDGSYFPNNLRTTLSGLLTCIDSLYNQLVHVGPYIANNYNPRLLSVPPQGCDNELRNYSLFHMFFPKLPFLMYNKYKENANSTNV